MSEADHVAAEKTYRAIGRFVFEFSHEFFDLGTVRVRFRLAEHFLSDRAKQRHVVALDDGRKMLFGGESDFLGEVVMDRIFSSLLRAPGVRERYASRRPSS